MPLLQDLRTLDAMNNLYYQKLAEARSADATEGTPDGLVSDFWLESRTSGSSLSDYRWNKWWGLELDKTQKHSGETSCKIKAKKIDWRGASQVILRPENSKIIIISGWMKTENILPNGKPWNNAQIGVRFMKTNDQEDMKNYVGKQYPPVVGSAKGTSDWKKYKREYSIPKECGFIEINLMCGTASGTAWFDDIYVEIK